MVGLIVDEKTLKTINAKHTDIYNIVTGILTSMDYNTDGKFADQVVEIEGYYLEFDDEKGVVWMHKKPKKYTLEELIDQGKSISEINQIMKEREDE